MAGSSEDLGPFGPTVILPTYRRCKPSLISVIPRHLKYQIDILGNVTRGRTESLLDGIGVEFDFL
jgi:hypothetical protein